MEEKGKEEKEQEKVTVEIRNTKGEFVRSYSAKKEEAKVDFCSFSFFFLRH